MSHARGEEFPTQTEIILVLLLIQGIFLFIFVTRSFRSTGIRDFQFFQYHYFFVVINMPLNILAHRLEEGLLHIVVVACNTITLTSIYFTLYLHFLYMKYEKVPKKLVIPPFIIFVFSHLILFFATYEVLPISPNYLGLEINVLEAYIGIRVPVVSSGSIYFGGLGINLFQRGILRLVLISYGLYVYATTELAINTKRVRMTQVSWIIAIVFWLIHPIGISLYMLFGTRIPDSVLYQLITGVIGFLIISYIVFKYPEMFLISKVQLIRANELYTRLQNVNIDT